MLGKHGKETMFPQQYFLQQYCLEVAGELALPIDYFRQA